MIPHLRSTHKKRGMLATIADTFAATVIGMSLLFILIDSIYLIRHYVPILFQKAKSWNEAPADGSEILPEGNRATYYYGGRSTSPYGQRGGSHGGNGTHRR